MQFKIQVEGEYSSYIGTSQYERVSSIHRNAAETSVTLVLVADPRTPGWVQVYAVGRERDVRQFKSVAYSNRGVSPGALV